MPERTDSPDPLQDIFFLKIPEKFLALLPPLIKADTLLPFEIKNKDSLTDSLSLEALIAGMLRILIYQPSHPQSDLYRELVLILRPNIKDEFTNAGILKASQKDFSVAIEIFSALKALFPNCPYTLLNAALVFHDAAISVKQDLKLYEKYCESAFASYQAALKAKIVLPETHLNYAYFLLLQENFEKALAHFEYYLKHYPTQSQEREKIETIANNLSQIITADNLFKEAFDYISMGKEELGVKKARELLAKNPDFWNGWFLLGWGLRKMEQYAEAKEAFLKALSLTDPKPDLLNELAISYLGLNDLDESYKCLREALKLEPENTKVISNLGIVSLKKGQLEEAKGFFRTVLEYDPTDSLAHNFLKELESAN